MPLSKIYSNQTQYRYYMKRNLRLIFRVESNNANCSHPAKKVRKELLKRTGEWEESDYGARRCLRFKFNVNMRFNGLSKAGCVGADRTHQHSVPSVFPFLSTCTNVQINLPQCTQETSFNNHIFPTFALFTSETFHSPSANFCWEL